MNSVTTSVNRAGSSREGNPTRRWAKRILLAVLLVVAALLVAGMTYQAAATALDQRRFPPPGEMIDVGGYRLHLHAMGEGHDGPTVILENGGGGFSPQWGWVQPEVATFARVVSYDRPGTGWSDASPEPLDAVDAAQALHTALERAGVDGPYILVGHSMGALMVRVFAGLYPDEVAGMVLVDPRDLTWEGVFPESEAQVNRTFFRVLAILSRLGVGRLTGVAAQQAAGLPPQQYAEAVALGSTTHQAEGMLAEATYGETAIATLKAGEMPGDWPLIVLSAGAADENFDGAARSGFTALHARLAETLSSQGAHRVVEGAGHITIVLQQENAQHVIDAVREVVATVRP